MDVVQNFCEHYVFPALAETKKHTEPLHTHYSVDNFFYYHIEADGSWYAATDHLEISYKYLEANLHCSDPLYVHPSLLPQMNVVTSMVQAKSFQDFDKAYKQELDVTNRYMIIRKPSLDTCEVFGFSTCQKSNNLCETAVQTPQVFEKFANYWLEKSARMRKKLSENRILLTELRSAAFTQKTDFHKRLQFLDVKNGLFLRDIVPQNKSFLEPLTSREKECVFWYLQGLTAYETGRKLFISKRTVEAHFDHIKQKLDLQHKRTLLQKVDPLSLALDLKGN
jgi:DNA-binding CsgD family transcriptional regulator